MAGRRIVAILITSLVTFSLQILGKNVVLKRVTAQ